LKKLQLDLYNSSLLPWKLFAYSLVMQIESQGLLT